MTWLNGRVYEKEYKLASRIGSIVGRKMCQESIKIVKFNVHPDNKLTNWFPSEYRGYSDSYGGWSNHVAKKCFSSELYSAWLKELVNHSPLANKYDLYATHPPHALLIVRSKYTIIFLKTLGCNGTHLRILLDLAYELAELERLALKTSTNIQD